MMFRFVVGSSNEGFDHWTMLATILSALRITRPEGCDSGLLMSRVGCYVEPRAVHARSGSERQVEQELPAGRKEHEPKAGVVGDRKNNSQLGKDWGEQKNTRKS